MRMRMQRRAAFGLVCVVTAGAAVLGLGTPSAADGWQDEVHLRPESVDVLLGVDRDGHAASSPLPAEAIVDPTIYRNVTVVHDASAGACETPGAVRVTMTGTGADGAQATLLSQCEVNTVSSGEAREAASDVARDVARLTLPTAGFDPRVRGLVGLRTWLHIGIPDQKFASVAVDGYALRAVARPIAVEVTLDGVKQAVRLTPEPGTPLDAVGPFVFTRSGRHHLSVRVQWIAEWALVNDTGAPVRFGTLSNVPGATVSTDYTVVQAQARIR